MNGALLSRFDVDGAVGGLRSMGLRAHQTREKNWDMAEFIDAILEHVPEHGTVLDVGCAGSPLLANLSTLGYRDLHGIDFELDGTIWSEGITFYARDLMATTFPDASFDCVTSLSVIEHGCEPAGYMREMARILKPGGLLLTSTDFWPEKVRTWTVPRRKTFGLPWKIMTEEDVRALVDYGRAYGMEPTSPLSFEVQDKVVRWEGKNYTFFSFALRKTRAIETRRLG